VSLSGLEALETAFKYDNFLSVTRIYRARFSYLPRSSTAQSLSFYLLIVSNGNEVSAQSVYHNPLAYIRAMRSADKPGRQGSRPIPCVIRLFTRSD